MKLPAISPVPVWQFFEELSQIPRCSRHEEAVIEFIKHRAESLGLSWKMDKTGNLAVYKKAFPGKEKAPGVILQAHVDMVCEQNRGRGHDFTKDPISLKMTSDGWVKADGTTLGADNGIGAAYGLAVLADSQLVHGPLACLFTIDEETALTGALGLDPSLVSGKFLVNLDSEEEGHFTIGCAGGMTGWGTVPLEWEGSKSKTGWVLGLTGLPGGHSGTEIHRNIPNSIQIGTRFLWDFLRSQEGKNWSVVSLEGGDKHNAIPREIFITLTGGTKGDLEAAIKKQSENFKSEWKGSGLELNFSLEEAGPISKVISPGSFEKVLRLLTVLPHGPAGTSRAVPGLVETSSNLAAVKVEEGQLKVLVSHRSAYKTLRDEQSRKAFAAFQLVGGTYSGGDGYPAWSPDPESKLLGKCLEVWQDLYSATPVVEVIHAGLECGVIGDKIPGLDMISFGPDILGAHTPEERVRIESVDRVWKFLIRILEELC